MQTAKVMCHGTQVSFFCYSKDSPDIVWRPLIERTFIKWKQLTNDDQFLSSYLQGSLVFLLLKKDDQIEIHHWLKPEQHIVPADIVKIAQDLQSTTMLNQGLFAAEIQPWKMAE